MKTSRRDQHLTDHEPGKGELNAPTFASARHSNKSHRHPRRRTDLVSLVFRDPFGRPRLDSEMGQVAGEPGERAMGRDDPFQAILGRRRAVDTRVDLFVVDRERLLLVFENSHFGEHGQRSGLQGHRSGSRRHPARVGTRCSGGIDRPDLAPPPWSDGNREQKVSTPRLGEKCVRKSRGARFRHALLAFRVAFLDHPAQRRLCSLANQLTG